MANGKPTHIPVYDGYNIHGQELKNFHNLNE